MAIQSPILFSLADQSFSQTKSIGILNVSVGLLCALSEAQPNRELVLFGAELVNGCIPNQHRFSRVVPFDYASRSRLGRMWYDQVAIYRAARKFPGGWLFLPKGYASFLLPPPRQIRLACYVHDAMQVHYRERHPHFFPRIESDYFWRGFLATLRRAHLVLTNSQFTADEISAVARLRGLRTGPIKKVGIGFSAVPSRQRNVPRVGMVVLISRMPHKLTAKAVAWLSQWQAHHTGFQDPIHWIGSLPSGVRLDSFPNWRHAERLDDARYNDLISGSRVLVYFSEYEGFGMPPVEAVLQGTAPVYSDIPATREAMGQMGFSFTNDSYDDFAEAVRRALACETATLEKWAARLVERTRWTDVAKRVLDVLT